VATDRSQPLAHEVVGGPSLGQIPTRLITVPIAPSNILLHVFDASPALSTLLPGYLRDVSRVRRSWSSGDVVRMAFVLLSQHRRATLLEVPMQLGHFLWVFIIVVSPKKIQIVCGPKASRS
jgi:hypothetical protein